jgi:hypothetical protein
MNWENFSMDAKFHPAIRAIKSGDLEGLRTLLEQDRSLATARSARSHPTLLQCLALEALDVPNKIEMAQLLIDAGAEINGALGAAACIDNVEIASCCLIKAPRLMAQEVGRPWKRLCIGIISA